MKVKTGPRAGTRVKDAVEMLSRPLRPMPKLDWSQPLVQAPRCTNPTPCGHCHYCLISKHGPLYWEKGIR